MELSKRLGVPLLMAGMAVAGSANAALVTRIFDWVGTTGLNGYDAGYSASGSFTFDDSYSLVEAEGFEYGDYNDGLESLSVSFFDELGNHLYSVDDVVGGVINYDYFEIHFDTATEQFFGWFEVGQDTGNDPWEHYVAGTIGGQSWLVEADSLDDLNTILTGTTVSVSAVPVPAALWLLGSGLLGLVGTARRNQSTW